MGINGTLCAMKGGVAVSEVAWAWEATPRTQSLAWESDFSVPSLPHFLPLPLASSSQRATLREKDQCRGHSKQWTGPTEALDHQGQTTQCADGETEETEAERLPKPQRQ